MFKCPKCNTLNLDNSKYCKECGTEIWFFEPIQKLPASQITVEILFNNVTCLMKQYKIPDFTNEVLKEGLIEYILDPLGWPTHFAKMYFENCNIYNLSQEIQVIVVTGYYAAMAIEKTIGETIDIPINIINKTTVEYSKKWISDFSFNINSKGTEMIENLFNGDLSLMKYFNNMFPVSDKIISKLLMDLAECNYNKFISTKKFKKKKLLKYEQDSISSAIYNYTSWGFWIRYSERIAEIYRDTYH